MYEQFRIDNMLDSWNLPLEYIVVDIIVVLEEPEMGQDALLPLDRDSLERGSAAVPFARLGVAVLVLHIFDRKPSVATGDYLVTVHRVDGVTRAESLQKTLQRATLPQGSVFKAQHDIA